MTALTVAALLLALAGGAVGLHYRRQNRRLRLEVETERQRGERAEQTVETIRADTETALRQLGAQVADAGTIIARLTAERDQARAKITQAYDEGYRSLSMLDKAIGRQQDEFAESLAAWQAQVQAWQALAVAALTIPQAALTAARSTPELLPSGEHALVDGDPALLVQLDGDPLYDGPDPPGVNGQQRTTTRARTRKKAADNG